MELIALFLLIVMLLLLYVFRKSAIICGILLAITLILIVKI